MNLNISPFAFGIIVGFASAIVLAFFWIVFSANAERNKKNEN